MPEDKPEEQEYDAEMVAKAVKGWLGNPISRSFLRLATGDTEEGPRLELLLRKYIGDNVRFHGLRDRIGFRVVKFAIDKGSESFGVTKEQMNEALKEPIFRRAIVNILEGISKFGVQRPQTTVAPFLVVWDYTHCCNLRCQHCYEDSDGTFLPDELTTEEAKKIIDEFARAGVVALAFSGGEPLMRKDFFEVARYAADKDFYVTMASNGTLITPEVAKKIKEAGVDYIEISLDGFEKEHDKLRRVLGAWKKACQGIRNCVAAGLDTCAATTVTKYNYKILPRFVDFVEKELRANRMICFNFVPTRRGKGMVNEDLSPDEREEVLKFLYEKLMDKNCKLQTLCTAPQYARIAQEFGGDGPAITTHFTNKAATEALRGKAKSLGEFIGGCGAGRLYCGLEPNGDVQPCVFIPIKIGNIREQSIKEIWENSPVLKQLREREKFEGCNSCKYLSSCGGCRARAYGYFGNLQGPDPGCINNKKYWEQIQKSEVKPLAASSEAAPGA